MEIGNNDDIDFIDELDDEQQSDEQRQDPKSDNYQELENKPTINGVVLEPNMELSDIGLVEMTPGMVAELVLETFGIIL